jgi:drug/metabolite transporter (DMT)-like permease
MPYLLLVTLIWAFSFSLIGEYLAGRVDSDFAVLVRVAIAFVLFLPFTRWRGVPGRFALGLMAAGALQFGITYLCLYRSFAVLTVPEVLLFTVLTPIYVTLLDDAWQRRLRLWSLLAAVVAVGGAALIRFQPLTGDYLLGFLLLQVANLTFAAGQVLCKAPGPCLCRTGRPASLLRPVLSRCPAGGGAVLSAVRQSGAAAQHRPAMGRAGVDGRLRHGARPLLVDAGFVAGQRRHPGDHERGPCAGRSAGQPADLAAPGRSA